MVKPLHITLLICVVGEPEAGLTVWAQPSYSLGLSFVSFSLFDLELVP